MQEEMVTGVCFWQESIDAKLEENLETQTSTRESDWTVQACLGRQGEKQTDFPTSTLPTKQLPCLLLFSKCSSNNDKGESSYHFMSPY